LRHRLTASSLAAGLTLALVPGLHLSLPARAPGPGSVRDVAIPVPSAAGRLTASVPGGASWTSAELPLGNARMLGFSWKDGTSSRVRFRTAGATGWSGWRDAEPEDAAPDPGTADAAAKPGTTFTEPVWLDEGTTRYQLSVAAPPRAGLRTQAEGVPGLTAHLVEPDLTPTTASSDPAGGASAAPARPAIITRAQWGADERIRGSIDYGRPVKVGFVHHTVQSNSYRAADSAALIRADYLYHVKTRGWSDIGYNFVVDRYGQVFEGRAGGMDRSVLGAHTGGMNSGSFGVALIGDFSTASVPGVAQRALARLFAWKLDVHHSDPLGTTVMRSAGGSTSRYKAGRLVTVRNISGHRDTNLTACPGAKGYTILAGLRRTVNATGRPKIYGGGASGPIDLERRTSAVFAARFTTRASWGATAVAADGRVMRRWSGRGTSVRLVWNGRDARNKGAALGTAKVTITAAAGGASARPVVAAVAVKATQRVLAPPDGTALSGGNGARVAGGARWPYAGSAERAADAGPSAAVTLKRAQAGLVTGPRAPLPDGVLARAKGSPLYLVSDGRRRQVVNAAARAGHGLGSTPVTWVPKAELDRLPEGPVLGAGDPLPDGVVLSNGARAWRMEDGRARPITSVAVTAWKARTPPAAAGTGVRNPSNYPAGARLGFPDGTLVRNAADGAVWAISDGARRHLASTSALAWLGYGRTRARVVRSAAGLSAHPAGAALTAGSPPPSGALIRSGATTWLAVGARRLVVPGAVLPALRQAVGRVSGGVAGRLPGAVRSYPDGTWLRAASGKLWVVSGGRRRPVDDGLASGALAGVSTRPLTASAFAVLPPGPAVTSAAPLPDGTMWRFAGNNRVYRIEEGRRRLVAVQAEDSWAPVPVTTAPGGWNAFEDLHTGPVLGWRDGVLIRSTTSGRVWAVTGGRRRWVATAAAMAGAGLSRAAAQPGSEATLALHRRAADLR
jgi:hypothetical protein